MYRATNRIPKKREEILAEATTQIQQMESEGYRVVSVFREEVRGHYCRFLVTLREHKI